MWRGLCLDVLIEFEAEQLIGRFVLKCAGIVPNGEDGVLAEKLVGDDEKVTLMEKGGDLRRNESVG